MHSSWLDPRKIREMTIVGSKRMIVYDDVAPLEKIRVFDARVERPPHYDTFAEFHYAYHYGDIYVRISSRRSRQDGVPAFSGLYQRKGAADGRGKRAGAGADPGGFFQIVETRRCFGLSLRRGDEKEWHCPDRGNGRA